MKICRVRKCNVERPVLPYFCSKLFELQVPFLNFLNLFGVLDPCDCGFPKLGPKTSMIFADTREFTRSISPSLSRRSKVCKEIARLSSIIALSTTLLVDAFVVCSTQKKKNTHERCTSYAASLSAMVEPDSTFLRSSTCCSRWTEVCGKGFW